jgi:hypothetical protein
VSDDLDLRGIDQRHEPDPQFRAALQRRLTAIVAGADPGAVTEARDLAMIDLSDEQLVPVKEIYVSLDSPPTSETRNRRRLAMAAAAFVAVIGVATIAINIRNSDDGVDPAPAAEPTVAPTTVAPTTVAPTTVAPTTVAPTTVAPTTVAPTTKTVSFRVANIPVTFAAPVDWTAFGGWLIWNFQTARAGVAFQAVTNIYADGCQWVLLDPPVGPTVDDLVSAWATVPGLAATAPVDITVDGYAGKQIELTVPDYGETECKDSTFGLWQDPGAPETTGSQPNRWAQGPNQHSQLWILDVDGTRVVIEAFSFPDTSPQDRAAIDEVLASIQIG